MIKMIDSIRLYTNNIAQIDLGYIEQQYELTQLAVKDYTSFTTTIKNIKFTCDNYGIYLEGSAPKFLNGNNIATLKHNEIGNFIDTLSEAVGFNVGDLTISRLDIADNIEVDSAPKTYKKHLGNCRYFQKIDYEFNGMEYINKTRTHRFYDKTLEQKIKKFTIPDEYINKNLLRYEYCIKAKRREHLGATINTLSDLNNSNNYLILIDKWHHMFNQIDKNSSQSKVPMPYIRGMSPNAYYCLLGAKTSGGIERSLQDIGDWQTNAYITKRIAQTMKRNLNKYQNQYNNLSNGEIIDGKTELLMKFQQKVEENKNMVR